MELKITKKIGKRNYDFTFTGKDLHEVIMESQTLSFDDIPACGCCGSNDLYLSAHVAQGKHKYTEVRCMDCKAEVNFGKRQDNDNVFYIRKNDQNQPDWKPFVKHETQSAPPANKSNNHKTETKQPDAPAKPSGKASVKALEFATKIASAKTMQGLKAVCGAVKTMTDFTDFDKQYLNDECLRRKNILTASHAEKVG